MFSVFLFSFNSTFTLPQLVPLHTPTYNLLLLLYNMPLTFLHYVNNSIKIQIQSQKLKLFEIFAFVQSLIILSYIQKFIQIFPDFIS